VDQQRLIAAQTPVLELQARDLGQSLVERCRDREQRQRDQASRVFMLSCPNRLCPAILTHGMNRYRLAQLAIYSVPSSTSVMPRR
jgi:hypothetical protein